MQSPHTNLSVMKLYILIQRFLGRKYVHYFVLFFILISIAAIIGSSYEEMAAYRLPLFGVTYVSSFVFLVEYIARILSAPALYPGRKAVKAHILFLWICRFRSCATLYPYLYILGYGSGACHHPALYFYHFQTDTALSFFPDYRPGALSRKRGT